MPYMDVRVRLPPYHSSKMSFKSADSLSLNSGVMWVMAVGATCYIHTYIHWRSHFNILQVKTRHLVHAGADGSFVLLHLLLLSQVPCLQPGICLCRESAVLEPRQVQTYKCLLRKVLPPLLSTMTLIALLPLLLPLPPLLPQ